jgi:hypothetical protein
MKYRNRSVIRVRAAASCLAVGLLGLGIAACGSSSSSSTGSAAVAGTSVASTNARYEARLNLAKCLRSQGLNVPDPSPNAGVAGGGGVFRQLANVPRTQVQSAMTHCQQYVKQAFPAANLTPAQQEQFRQSFVKYADCMRSHGINVPDPGSTGSTTGGAPGGGFGFRGAISSAERNSPAFQSANKACRSLRPRFGGGGAGGATGA